MVPNKLSINFFFFNVSVLILVSHHFIAVEGRVTNTKQIILHHSYKKLTRWLLLSWFHGENLESPIAVKARIPAHIYLPLKWVLRVSHSSACELTVPTHLRWGLPCSSNGKESACNLGVPGLIPGLGRSSGEGNGNSLQVFLPGEPHGQRSLAGYSPWDRRGSETTERLTLPYTWEGGSHRVNCVWLTDGSPWWISSDPAIQSDSQVTSLSLQVLPTFPYLVSQTLSWECLWQIQKARVSQIGRQSPVTDSDFAPRCGPCFLSCATEMAAPCPWNLPLPRHTLIL